MDILNPDVFVDTEVFKDSVKRNNGGGGENGSKQIFNGLGFVLEVSDEGIVEGDVGNGGHQAAVEAGVVTPETGVGVDGDDGRDDLGSEEEKNGDVERGFGDLKFFI